MDTGRRSLYPFVRCSREDWASLPVDAEESDLKAWYLERFLRLREEALEDRSAYFHRFAELSVEQATEIALRV